jgi:hypothetical protein
MQPIGHILYKAIAAAVQDLVTVRNWRIGT